MKRCTRLFLLLALLAGLGHAPSVLAVVCTSNATGNWATAATWLCGGVAAVPTAADTVTIRAVDTVR